MKQLELEALVADRDSVRVMLASFGKDDPIGNISFNARLAAIDEKINRLMATHETTGSVALMFAGGPVIGSRSIEAGFATTILKSFQDLVTKRIAGDEFGRLGTRGRLPERIHSTLSIRELVRGSVGFVLEENSANGELSDTSVKKAIQDVATIISRTANESQRAFEESVETLDPRMLVSLGEFFRTLDDGEASVRIVEGERDDLLNKQAVHRARIRIDETEVIDTESNEVIGELLGVLPEGRRFEMKLRDNGQVIKGTVSASLAIGWPELMEQQDKKLVGQVWRTKMRIREIKDRKGPPRNLYSLLGLIERL